MVRIIKNKISIENKMNEFEFKKREFEDEIERKKTQTPGVKYTWQQIAQMIKKKQNR